MKRIYAVLDIGSTTLKLLVAELMSTNINILFTKKLASHAIEGGLIKNEEVLVDEIRSIIKEADAECYDESFEDAFSNPYGIQTEKTYISYVDCEGVSIKKMLEELQVLAKKYNGELSKWKMTDTED